MSDVPRNLSRLRSRIRDVLSKHGLKEQRTVFEAPPQEGDSLEITMIFLLDEDAKTAVVIEVDESFDEVMRGAAEAERAEKAERAKAELEELHRKLDDDPKGGFL